MKLITKTLFFLLLVGSFQSHAQDLAELERRNGFKDIKLGSSPSSYAGLRFEKNLITEKGDTLGVYSKVTSSYPSIGGIAIKEMEITSYRDQIFRIAVETEKDPRLYKALVKAFGKPEIAPRDGKYRWRTSELRLVFSSAGKARLQMEYYSYAVAKKIKLDKEEDIVDLSDDF